LPDIAIHQGVIVEICRVGFDRARHGRPPDSDEAGWSVGRRGRKNFPDFSKMTTIVVDLSDMDPVFG
jgi:hypothetical protein